MGEQTELFKPEATCIFCEMVQKGPGAGGVASVYKWQDSNGSPYAQVIINACPDHEHLPVIAVRRSARKL